MAAGSTHSEASSMSRLGQNFNSAGISLFLQILGGNRSLALPHISVPDIRWLDWAALRAAGFKGCVFDKDNTLSEPFAPKVDPRLERSLAQCREAFGDGNLVLYSNSAGLKQYDPEGAEAARLEADMGVAVLRHIDKKPAGGCAELEQRFGCKASELVMIGDRYLTDVVFGNRHGMLTIRPAPLTNAGEPPGVVMARRVEEFFVARWVSGGTRAAAHPLVPDGNYAKFVLDPGVW